MGLRYPRSRSDSWREHKRSAAERVALAPPQRARASYIFLWYNLDMTNEEFFNLFKIPENYYLERVLFIDQADDIGFSILKEYPLNSLFKPVKNRNGQDDDVVMIRIAFNKKEINKPVKKLFIDVVKVSRYKLKHQLIHSNTFEMYDTDSPEYPTEESIKESLESTQPENLSFRNVILKEDGTFFDNDESKPYYGFGLIEHVYSKHKSTYSISAAMIKIGIHKFLLRSLEYIGNLFLLLRNSGKNTEDFFSFYWKSTKYLNDPREKLADSEMKWKPYYLPLAYSDFKIYPLWTIVFTGVVMYLFYLD